ncbi:MAG TPA: SBBP repeat-containing protein [bacterium]|nr:SBBP repeat-containing protein [bacterium]
MKKTFLISFLLFLIAACDDEGDKAFGNNAWIKQWGTGSEDTVLASAVDSEGNVFVSGYTSYPPSQKLNDAFLIKWDSEGKQKWIKQWMLDENGSVESIGFDSKGNFYTVGSISNNETIPCDSDGLCVDIVFTKWSSDGTKIWTKYYGTGDWDYPNSMVVDKSDNIFMTGETKGGLNGNENAGREDIFLMKLDTDGSVIWTKQLGTEGYEYGTSVVVDDAGNIYVSGIGNNSLNGGQTKGEADLFVIKWNSEGEIVWTVQWGTDSDDRSESMAIDSDGNLYITGVTYRGLDGNTSAGEYDVFITKLDSNGVKKWTKQWGTKNDEWGYSVTIDSSGSIFVTGTTQGSLDGETLVQWSDIFLSKFRPDGTFLWTKQWGSEENDAGYSIVTDLMDNIILMGTVSGSLEGNEYAGDKDIFVMKWNAGDL